MLPKVALHVYLTLPTLDSLNVPRAPQSQRLGWGNMSCSRSPPILASSRPVPGEALCHWYRNPSKPVPTNESASRQSSYKYGYNHAHSSLSLSRVAVIFHFSVVASSMRAEPASLSVAGAICMSMRSCSFAARSMVDAQP